MVQAPLVLFSGKLKIFIHVSDSKIGAACCTGDGDQILRYCPSIQVVNLMHQGAAPDTACEMIIRQINDQYTQFQDDMFELGIIAMDYKVHITMLLTMNIL